MYQKSILSNCYLIYFVLQRLKPLVIMMLQNWKKLSQKSNFLLTTEVSEDKQRKQRIENQILISLLPLLNLCFLCG